MMDRRNILLMKDVSSIFSCGRLKQVVARTNLIVDQIQIWK